MRNVIKNKRERVMRRLIFVAIFLSLCTNCSSVIWALIENDARPESKAKTLAGVCFYPSAVVSRDDAKQLTETLAAHLEMSGNIEAVGYYDLASVLGEKRFSWSGPCTSFTCHKLMSEFSDMDIWVEGSVGKLGSLIMINIRVTDLHSGAIIKMVSHDFRGENIQGAQDFFPNLSYQILTNLLMTKPYRTMDSLERQWSDIYAYAKKHNLDTWFKEGDIPVGTGKYKNGEKDSTWVFWRIDGQRAKSFEFSQGVGHGKAMAWHKNGQVQTSGAFLNGRLNGEYAEWLEDGKLVEKGYYTYGDQDSLWEFWSPKGYKKQDGFFDMGETTGVWRDYYETGRTAEEKNYMNGSRTGLSKKWYENGQKMEEGEYLSNTKTGNWITFHENGQMASQSEYLNGEKTGSWKTWYETGKLSSQWTWDASKNKGKLIHYYDNGQKREEKNFKEGHLHGKLMLWHKNGNLESETPFLNGGKEGRASEYYSNGQPMNVREYQNNKYHGSVIRWDENGRTWCDVQCREGRIFSGWIIRDGIREEFINGRPVM